MKESVKETIGYIINGSSILLYIFLASAIDDPLCCPYLHYTGWILLAVGIILILASFSTLFRNRGKGLIEWGIYGIVRHPMYVGAILMYLSWVFLLPNWLALLLAITNVVIVYWFILQADRRNLDFFGSEYEHYVNSVPRANIVSGFLKSLRRS